MVETVNYLDDLGGAEIPELADESFRKMGNLLLDLRIAEYVNKACGSCTRMLFLGIIVDTVKMTLELDEIRLLELCQLLDKWGNMSHVCLKHIQSLVGVFSFASGCISRVGHFSLGY